MPSSALAPFGVILDMSFDSGSRLGDIPGVTVMRVPMAMMPEFELTGGEKVWSLSRPAVVTHSRSEQIDDWNRHSATAERISSWLSEHNRELIGGVGWSSTGADDMSNVRPAPSVAAR
ncbi:hypothetical protein B8W73_11555 [Arthrobacter agilis]|nr:hypothetical protein B8W73_11555 [Arthrobacter agilis]